MIQSDMWRFTLSWYMKSGRNHLTVCNPSASEFARLCYKVWTTGETWAKSTLCRFWFPSMVALNSSRSTFRAYIPKNDGGTRGDLVFITLSNWYRTTVFLAIKMSIHQPIISWFLRLGAFDLKSQSTMYRSWHRYCSECPSRRSSDWS